jgi:hypothetical protein
MEVLVGRARANAPLAEEQGLARAPDRVGVDLGADRLGDLLLARQGQDQGGEGRSARANAPLAEEAGTEGAGLAAALATFLDGEALADPAFARSRGPRSRPSCTRRVWRARQIASGSISAPIAWATPRAPGAAPCATPPSTS